MRWVRSILRSARASSSPWSVLRAAARPTLLESLAGLVALTEGSVLFEGKKVAGEAPEGIGVVFQEDASLPWLSVYENAAFGLRRKGASEATIRERVEHALSFMGLAAFKSAYPASSPAACASACASRARSSCARG